MIEPEPYQLALEQAQASVSSADAAAKQSQADYDRTAELVKKGFATQQDLDGASAQQAADAARQKQAAVDVKQAQLNLDYTEVKAPFDGIVTARQVSMGQLVSRRHLDARHHRQLDPIHVNFNVSETDVQSIRADILARGITARGPEEDPGRGRPADRDRLSAQGHARLRSAEPHRFHRHACRRAPCCPMPTARCCRAISCASACRSATSRTCCWCRTARSAADQSGRYVLVAGKDDVVEQRTVEIGQLVGELRVIAKGITADDRVVISGHAVGRARARRSSRS